MKFNNSLTRKLLFFIVISSSILTLLITCLQLYIDYRTEVKSINSRIIQLKNSNHNTLAQSLWSMNIKQVNNILDGMLLFSDIQYLEVRVEKKLFAQSGKFRNENTISKQFGIEFTNLNKRNNVGSLLIVATLEAVHQRIFDKILIILASQGVKTFLVSIFILFIVHYLITRHLVTMSVCAQELNLDCLGTSLTLDRRKPRKPDELERVVIAFNEMQERMRLDLKNRINAEEALRESDSRFRAAFNSAQDCVLIWDKDYNYLYANQSAIDHVGTTPDKVIGENIRDGLGHVPDFMNLWMSRIDRVFETGEVMRVQDKQEIQGCFYHTDSIISPVYTTKKAVSSVCVVYRDVTELKQAEIALSQEKERLHVTLRSIGDGVITSDTNGRVTLINKIGEKLTGWTQVEAIGKDIKEVFNIINTKTRQKCENPVEKVLEAKTIIGLANHTNLISRDGTERMIADSGAPIFDTNSEIVGVVLVFRDVTENYRIEKQLQQSQKMEAIGTLAGGIAHDFNNMLGVITGNISYALTDLNKDGELYEVLSDIQKSSKQAQDLTHQLLTFSKGGAPIKKVSNINKLINDSAIFSLRGSKTNCIFKLSDELWTTEIDEGQINQVIGNLVINANQAMPNGGTITISTENAVINSKSGIPLSAGRYIIIAVEDQGVGISKKHLSNIFDPYFTTKQKGNGLGLATTYSIINNHGGHISVYSEIEQGTVFNMYLPASTKYVGKIEENEESKHTGQGKILIMDDQEPILDMTGRILNRMGYESTCTLDGSEAITKYKEAQSSYNAFDLVILDLTVPGGMGGLKTIIELLKIDPNVKAVVSSGYSNDPIMANYEDYGFCGVVPKPYTKAQLAEVLNKIFSKKG
ncbi:PAS domain S-box protein [Desulfobacterales bacterium HSG16]|nr:PAS domain S-box protein [Desulfobacterales bacterium HSG16]